MEANQSSSALAPAGSMPLTFAATSWLSWLLATIGIFTVSKLRFTGPQADSAARARAAEVKRSEEHTSETPVTNAHLVCRLLLEKKKKTRAQVRRQHTTHLNLTTVEREQVPQK